MRLNFDNATVDNTLAFPPGRGRMKQTWGSCASYFHPAFIGQSSVYDAERLVIWPGPAVDHATAFPEVLKLCSSLFGLILRGKQWELPPKLPPQKKHGVPQLKTHIHQDVPFWLSRACAQRKTELPSALMSPASFQNSRRPMGPMTHTQSNGPPLNWGVGGTKGLPA